MKLGLLLVTFVLAFVPAITQGQAQHEQAQRLEQMYPPTPKPTPELKCPPDRDFLGMSSSFMEKQNLCLRAGRPFYLMAKQNFRLCTQPLAQCPRDLQENIYVQQGAWVTVTKRVQGLVFVEYDYTPLARGAHDYVRGYADPSNLQVPQTSY